MMADKALVRRLSACETVGSATTICSDKTGTLTMNQMSVVGMCVAQNINGSVFVPENGNGVEVSGSPTEKAILHWGFQLGMDFEAVRSKSSIIHVFPFNSDKKRGGVALQTLTPSLQPDAEIHIHWKGAAEIILACCTRYFDTNDQLMTVLRNVIEDMVVDSLRCVAVAYRLLDETDNIITGKEELARWSLPENGLVLLAIVGLKDPCRPGVKDAVHLCQKAGVKVKKVTGDNVKTAKAIAVECGILDSLADATEPSIIEGKTEKHFEPCQTKRDKKLLKRYRLWDGRLLMTKSSDIIILDDNFASVVKVVKWERSVYANIQKFIQFQLTINIAALVINVIASFSTGDVPLNTVQLLWITLWISFGRRDPLVTNIMWRNLLIQAMYQVSVLLILNFEGRNILSLRHEISAYAVKVKNTIIFNAFVRCLVFNEFNAGKPDE
ncbi:unnamed protein product [Vicia faba]|uniref:Uncharacterized protein n=1 Tax=Vicia faba TaxID=3906 RepID=A0AAV1APV9_VICFA|nr:unnamed protein product [Vicia faba]